MATAPHPGIAEAEKHLAAAKDLYGRTVAGIARALKPIVAEGDAATIKSANRLLASAVDVAEVATCETLAALEQPAGEPAKKGTKKK